MTTEEHPGRADARRDRLRSVLLDVGALLGVLCLVAGIASVAFDVRPLVFRSGSMSPEIRTGAVALARDTDAPDLRVGDVVSVTNAAGTRITHRIVRLQGAGDTRVLTLKGDDNRAPDDETYPVARTPRVFAHLNGAGYVVSWLSGPPAVFAGGLLSGVLLMLVLGGGRRRPAPGGRRRGDGGSTSHRAASVATTGLAALLVLGTATGALVARPSSTLAAFTDASTATTSFSALTVVRPANLTCANNGAVNLGGYYSSITVSWTNNALLDYQVVVSVPGASKSYPVADGSSVTITGADLALLLALGTTPTVSVTAQPADTLPTVWTSTATTRTIGVLSVLGLASVRC